MRARAPWGLLLAVLFGVLFGGGDRPVAAAAPDPAPAAPAAPRPPDDYDRLGSLERIEVDAVLTDLHRAVDHAPEGKTVRAITIVNRPVFSDDDGFLTALNIFHWTTRDYTIRRELLFAAGEPWDPLLVDESLRNLRDPLFHNVLVIVPLETDEPGKVDALVVVRDVWSLRLQARYEVQGLSLITLFASVTENDLFGLRKRVAMSVSMDQGSAEVGPMFYDPNIAGTHLTLQTLARVIFARDGGALEGSHSDTTIAYPLWSLRQEWAAALWVGHYVGFQRSFLGTALRTYDNPDTAAVEKAPWVYHRNEVGTEAEVVRSFGRAVVQRVGVGHSLSFVRPSLPGDFSDDPTLRSAFTRDVLPRSELSSSVFAHWRLFTPVYAAFRDIDTFDFREDFLLGPSLDARVSAARTELGSDRDFVGLSATGGSTFAWADGLYRVAAGFSARLQDGALVDRKASLSLFAGSPVFGRTFRVLAAVNLDWLTDETNNRFYTIGGDNGLRGYTINEFSGRARVASHVELRTRPLRLAFFRIGGVAFWDAGHAAATLDTLSLHHGVGAGLRVVIPQLDQIVVRLDWAFPLSGAAAGWPGKVSLGVAQVF